MSAPGHDVEATSASGRENINRYSSTKRMKESIFTEEQRAAVHDFDIVTTH
jgi:hypothetical protein